MAAYSVTRFDAIDEIEGDGTPYRPVRQHFGIASFGVTSFTGRKSGDRIINEHSEEDDQEELYLVLQGHAAFELDGARVDAPAGTFVFAEPGVKRTAFAEEEGTTIIVVGGKPGTAYEVLGFEAWAPFQPLYEAGNYAEAAERSRETIEAQPEAVGAFFCLACCERAGRPRRRRREASEARARAVGAAAGARPPQLRPRLDPRPARDRRATRGVDVDGAAHVWARATASRDGDAEIAPLGAAREVLLDSLQEEGSRFVVAANDGLIVGFGTAEPTTSSRVAEVRYVGVDPDYWGVGVGGMVLTRMAVELALAGFDSAQLLVYADNVAARHLYERLGWTCDERELSIHPRTGRPELRYRLVLGGGHLSET